MADRYCIECGGPLEAEDKFCPACGAMVPKDADIPQGQMNTTQPGYRPEADAAHDAASGNLTAVLVMTLLWGVVSIATGLYLSVSADGVADSVISTLSGMDYGSGKTYWDMFTEEGYTRDMLVMGMQELGIMSVISGALALVSAYFVKGRKGYTVALMALVLSTVASFSMVFTLVVGFFVCYMLTKSKKEFCS